MDFKHKYLLLSVFLLVFFQACQFSGNQAVTVFNVKDYGATGVKSQTATKYIQAAIDACAEKGGGTVLLPAGEYTASTLVLKNNINLQIAAGATLYASRNANDYTISKGIYSTETDVPVLLMATGVKNLSITGKGTIDGQAEHVWEDLSEVDGFITDETELAQKSGVEMKRAYAVDPKVSLFYLVEVENLRIQDVSILRSPNWGMHIQWSNRVFIDNIYMESSLTHGVNSDGIDIDGCRDVVISNSIITTGDDAICLKSTNKNGRNEPCENITVTNCVTTSTSCALKLGTESHGDFKHILFNNCTVRNTNRALGIFARDGSAVSDVIFSNCTVETKRKHFNWWGDGELVRLVLLKRYDTSRLGSISNVVVKDIIATCEGTSLIAGHPNQNLSNITLQNIQMHMRPESTPDKRTTDAFVFDKVDGVTVKDVTVTWADSTQPKWGSALLLKNVNMAEVNNLQSHSVPGTNNPVIMLQNATDVLIRNSVALKPVENYVMADSQSKNIVKQNNLF